MLSSARVKMFCSHQFHTQTSQSPLRLFTQSLDFCSSIRHHVSLWNRFLIEKLAQMPFSYPQTKHLPLLFTDCTKQLIIRGNANKLSPKLLLLFSYKKSVWPEAKLTGWTPKPDDKFIHKKHRNIINDIYYVLKFQILIMGFWWLQNQEEVCHIKSSSDCSFFFSIKPWKTFKTSTELLKFILFFPVIVIKNLLMQNMWREFLFCDVILPVSTQSVG